MKLIKSLKPDLFVNRVSDIKISKLLEWKIEGLILDVDNTLLPTKSKKLSNDIKLWVSEASKKFKIIILSNNSEKKILRAARQLNLSYIPWTLKPLNIYYKIALLKLGLSAEKVCAIGDQIFTDILGGKLSGMRAIYVKPINEKEDSSWTKFVRIFERRLLKRWKIKI